MLEPNPRQAILTAVSMMHWMACRWVVDGAESPVSAVVLDCATRIVTREGGVFEDSRGRALQDPPVTVALRTEQHGPEMIRESYQMPVRLDHAAVAVHLYARRFADRRSTFTAERCNEATRVLIAAGVDLRPVYERDGVIWAAPPHGEPALRLTPAEQHMTGAPKSR